MKAMKSKRHLRALIAGGVLVASLASPGFGGSLPQEPSEEHLLDEDVNIITGLYTREYSLTGTEVVDYRTARQILLSEYNEYWNTVVQTEEFPLFYWYDADHDGKFEMWIDRQVEGRPCDIERYDAEGQAWEGTTCLPKPRSNCYWNL